MQQNSKNKNKNPNYVQAFLQKPGLSFAILAIRSKLDNVVFAKEKMFSLFPSLNIRP